MMIATRDAFSDAIVELGKINDKVVVFNADLAHATKTLAFMKAFPQRHFNAGIAEMNMAGMAAGMATCGYVPYVSTFAIFGTGRIYDMIRNGICYPNLNVKFALTHAGLTVGEDGATHQMLEDIALMNALPNMMVIVPADATAAGQAIFAAAEIPGPVYIRLGRAKTDVIYGADYRYAFGKANVLADGADVTLAACGIMVPRALKARQVLKEHGVDAAVVNFSTVKPIDKDAVLHYAAKTKAFVTCEEHSVIGGLGSVIASLTAENIPAVVKKVGVNDTFGESGSPDLLLEKYGLTVEHIVSCALDAVKNK
jgi:transketolase